MNQLHRIETDLLVAGGGMAGVCAAISAARQGVKVVLVQDRSVLGGNASSEVRMHIVGADIHGDRKGWRESGLIEELRLEDAVRNPERSYPLWDVLLYEKVIAEPNIMLLLDSDVIGADVVTDEPKADWANNRPLRTERLYEFNGPRHVRIRSARVVRQLTQDEFEVHAKYFADCTGDGRLGFEAGADFRIGRESKTMHGESLAQEKDDLFTLGNSIMLTSRNTGKPTPFVAPPWARRFTPEQLTLGRSISSWEYGFWWIEWGGMLDTIKDNCTTIRHELYRIALGLWDYVKNSGRYPQSANWMLDWIGAIPGKRESRRFIGHHMLTQQDVVENHRHEDEVAFGGWAIDLHPPRGIDALDEPPFTPTDVPQVYGIPLRSYFSRNVENLFFAGRDISATHVAFASTRVMATCALGGEAVGHAVSRCLQEEMTPACLVSNAAALRRLQLQLLRSDATLPNVRMPDIDDLLAQANVTASSTASNSSLSLLRDGVTRDEVNPDNGELIHCHGWRSEPLTEAGQWIEFVWPQAVKIREIHLWFDTGFQRELMLTPSDSHSSRTIRAAQPETVRDYSVLINGDHALSITDNFQRKRVHRFPQAVETRSMQIRITATNGVPDARLFQIRAYG